MFFEHQNLRNMKIKSSSNHDSQFRTSFSGSVKCHYYDIVSANFNVIATVISVDGVQFTFNLPDFWKSFYQ